MAAPWLVVERGHAPLILSMPHVGTGLADFARRFASPWLARKDADWHVERLYEFAAELGATTIRTTISRSVIDLNRDPSGASLYPGQATTELCPTTTFDGEMLYAEGEAPDTKEISARRAAYFDPYHAGLAGEIARLRGRYGKVAIYDCHSIRSRIPRLFPGELPALNLGVNGGASADPALIRAVVAAMRKGDFSQIVDGRFKGGWITRHYGQPKTGVHALQMELACRAYLNEPTAKVDETNWPAPYEQAYAESIQRTLRGVIVAILEWLRK
jgi:formiminoglutamase